MAKCGTLSDHGRDEAPIPTKYPIPKVTTFLVEASARRLFIFFPFFCVNYCPYSLFDSKQMK